MITVEYDLKGRKSIEKIKVNKNSLREKLIHKINHLIKEMEITHLDGWEEIQVSNLNLKDQDLYTIEELLVLLNFLEDKFETYLYDIYQEEFYINHNDSSEIFNK